MKAYKVHYHIASYSGTVTVSVDENADNDEIIATAKRILRQRSAGAPLPFGSESFRIEEA